MDLKIFNELPADAVQIRKTVFCDEQKFVNEFDEIDNTAAHLVLYDKDLPVATCRVFKDGGKFHIGRVAVVKAYRGKSAGAEIMRCAEEYALNNGGKTLVVSAQVRAAEFYKKQGFTAIGGEYFDEGCPHVKMLKNI